MGINGNHYGCYVREENGAIYAYADWHDEILIMDMNAQIGDSFFPPLHCVTPTAGDLEITVVDIYDDFIAGETRKVIELDTWVGPEYWIEGVGSTFAGLGMGVYDPDNWTALVCFSDSGVITYFNGATSCDNTNLSVPENMKDQIVLAPNPVEEVSILQLPSELNIDTVRIYDITGKVISEEIITKNYTTINAMDFAAGIYFYQALSENDVIQTDRFIVR